MSKRRKPNFLIGEKSPYLQEHAYNPVEWHPWGEAALKRAKNDGKPIFLSIGYSTCHWCHAMSRESFEDEETAAMINKSFIPIKVDREERPELDAYYMRAAQAMTGGGGWPLSVFLTPDLQPFYSGTYFPPEPRYGMPSFRQVLEFVAKVWRDNRGEAVEKSLEVAAALSETTTGSQGELDKSLLEAGYSALASSFDQVNGGFGGAPKFPLPLSIGYMLRRHFRTGSEVALKVATRSLDAMRDGGIRDHVGGGFHRYATDKVWLVPHFEKMLYDNALLAKVFIEAYQVTGSEEYSEVARETLSWILGEMRSPKGGFFSAQDADTDEGEGVYYTWTLEEVSRVLGDEAGGFCSKYGVTRNGNFEGRSILRLNGTARGPGPETVARWKRALLKARLSRPRPATDEKVLTSWNGLAISALSLGARVLGVPGYLEAASRSAEFVLEVNSNEGRLLRRSVGGEAGLEGTLEDYAFFTQGLLDLFEASSEPRWLGEAKRLTKLMIGMFLDGERGGFFMAQQEAPGRLKEDYDGPTPSGNSIAAGNLVRLSEFTGDPELREVAVRTLKCFAKGMEEQPSGHAQMLSVLDLLLGGIKEVVVTAPSRRASEPMVREANRAFIPNMAMVVAIPENYGRLKALTPLLEGRSPGKAAVAYVCENFNCKLPARTPVQLRSQLIQAPG